VAGPDRQDLPPWGGICRGGAARPAAGGRPLRAYSQGI